MAVLPALRVRSLDATCLVIGSMAPDFEYFFHAELEGRFGHTLPGLFGWTLPVTLVLAATWHFIVRQPLELIAPAVVARRLPLPTPWPRSIIACVISALIGGLTHLAWDGLTHAGGYAQRWFPKAVNRFVTVPVLGPIPIFRVLQHISTVIGLVVVTWFVVRALRRQTPHPIPDRARTVPRAIYIACTLVAIAALLARAWFVLDSRDPGTLVVAPISGLLAGTLVAAVIIRAIEHPARLAR
jgi:Domain of unknown function (DUF4184)